MITDEGIGYVKVKKLVTEWKKKNNCRPQSIEDRVSKKIMSSKVIVADLNGAKIKCKVDAKPEWTSTFCQSPHLKEGRETGNKNIAPGEIYW